MNTRRLDPQKVVERDRIASFLKRKHNFARTHFDDEIGQVVNRIAVNRLRDNSLVFVHRDIADDDKSGSGFCFKFLDPLRPFTGTQHQQPPLEPLAADQRPKHRPASRQIHKRQYHRVQRVRPPKRHPRHCKRHHRLKNYPERHRHQQPRNRKPERLQRVRSVNTNRHRRDLNRQRKGKQLAEAVADIIDMHPDLVGSNDPCGFRRRHQQEKIDQRQKQHRIRNIMFEEPDHKSMF